jgi:hypothetical protein
VAIASWTPTNLVGSATRRPLSRSVYEPLLRAGADHEIVTTTAFIDVAAAPERVAAAPHRIRS